MRCINHPCNEDRYRCGSSVPSELKGVYLEAQSWADLRDVQASDFLDYGGLSRVVESAEDTRNPVSPHYIRLAGLCSDKAEKLQ